MQGTLVKSVVNKRKDEAHEKRTADHHERTERRRQGDHPTRKPRANEVDGVDYIFTSREHFEEAIRRGELLEWAEFVGNYYGTPLAQVEELRNEGKNVLLEIEVQGADQVRQKCPDALSIFIIPPSMEELEKRIRGRRSEPEEIVQQRLAKAENEMKLVSNYKYIVCNEDPQLAAELISSIIKRHMYVEENV